MIFHMLSKQLSGIQMSENISQQPLLQSNNFNSGANILEGQSIFGLLLFLKIVFYFIFAIKIIELSFLRRKKYSLKERIYRKFLFAHQELLKNFTDEDKFTMETTLNNTIKNASIDFDLNSSRTRKARKHVSFQTNRNNYYDPKDWRQLQIRPQLVDKKIEIKGQNDMPTFEEQKLEQEFVQRQDLLGLNESQNKILPLESKIIEQEQQKLDGQPTLSSSVINNGMNFKIQL